MKYIAACPFCGDDADTYQVEPMHSIQNEGWYVRCRDCGAELGFEAGHNGEQFGRFASEDDAIEAWNKRFHNSGSLLDMINKYDWS